MLSKIKLHQGYIHIYYKKNKQTLYWNTKIKASKKLLNKDNLFKPETTPSWEDFNTNIIKEQSRVNQLILDYTNLDIVRSKLKKEDEDLRTSPKGSNVCYMISLWIADQTHVTSTTIENYTRLEKIVKEFRPQDILLDVDKKWLDKLKNYLFSKGQNNNTVNQYFKYFKWFWSWMVNEGYMPVNRHLKAFKIKRGESFQPSLTHSQIQVFVRYQPTTDTEKIIHDIFTVLLYTGMRYSDYLKLDRAMFDLKYIQFFATKTKTQCRIPIHPRVRVIAEEYDYQFPKFLIQPFRKKLKELCSKIEEFQTQVSYSELRGDETVAKNRPLWQLVNAHTARHTFTTQAKLNSVPDNIIMQMMGWKKPDMIYKYANISTNETEHFMI